MKIIHRYIIIILLVPVLARFSYAEPAKFNLNFNDAEVLSVIKIMGKATGKTFLFNKKDLTGKKITLMSDQKFTVDEAYRIFETILDVNGLTTIDEGNVIRIVNSKTAKISTTPLYDEKSKVGGAFITRIFPIRNVDIKQLRSTLAPLVSKTSILTQNQQANILVMRDTKANTDRLAEIIALIDQKQSNFQIKIYPLKHANAAKLVGIVTKVIAGTGTIVKGGRKTVLTADPRTNSLIIVYPSGKGIPVVESIIKDMDQPETAVSLELYPLQYADSSLLAGLLAKIFPTPKGGSPKIRVFAEKRTNNLILIGHPKTIIKVKNLISKLDIEIQQGEQKKRGNIHVYPLKNASAKTVAEVLQKVAKTFGSPATAGKGKKGAKTTAVTIIPDIPSNSLVIFASPINFAVIEDVIQSLDQIRPQVFIQVLIMEVKLSKSLDMGIQWQGGTLINEGPAAGGFATIGGVGSTGGPKTVETTIGEGAGSVLGIIGSPITFGGKQYATFNAFVKATQTDQEIDILSSPQILTLNNEEAVIKVGEIIPTVGSTKVDANGNVTTSIVYKEVGISLKITPQINSDNSIELMIDETSSNVIEGSVGAFDQGAITTLNRSIKTKIVVNSGQTVVLGGLISDEITQVENKTPCLGDIPILGWFFKIKQTKTTKTNLMIFLSPTVVRTRQELEDLTKSTTGDLRKARANRFRIDISKEYQMPDMIKKKVDNDNEEDRRSAPVDEE